MFAIALAIALLTRYSNPVPELPDIELYVTRIAERVVGQRIERIRFYNPFYLDPRINSEKLNLKPLFDVLN